jgi:hypothetical protein
MINFQAVTKEKGYLIIKSVVMVVDFFAAPNPAKTCKKF